MARTRRARAFGNKSRTSVLLLLAISNLVYIAFFGYLQASNHQLAELSIWNLLLSSLGFSFCSLEAQKLARQHLQHVLSVRQQQQQQQQQQPQLCDVLETEADFHFLNARYLFPSQHACIDRLSRLASLPHDGSIRVPALFHLFWPITHNATGKYIHLHRHSTRPLISSFFKQNYNNFHRLVTYFG
jgi:hypothetical protein